MCNVTNEILNALEFLLLINKREKFMFLNTLVRHDKAENKRNTHILNIKTFICKGFYEAFIYKWNTLFSLEPQMFNSFLKIFLRDVSLKNKRSYYFSTELKKNQTIKNIDQWKHVIK